MWSRDFVEHRTPGWAQVPHVWRQTLRVCADVIDVLSDLFILRGVPDPLRSANGPEFGGRAVREWIPEVGVRTAFIEPGSPWENCYCESFNSKLRDELLNGEIFNSLAEATILIERWRQHDNTKRPH